MEPWCFYPSVWFMWVRTQQSHSHFAFGGKVVYVFLLVIYKAPYLKRESYGHEVQFRKGVYFFFFLLNRGKMQTEPENCSAAENLCVLDIWNDINLPDRLLYAHVRPFQNFLIRLHQVKQS